MVLPRYELKEPDRLKMDDGVYYMDIDYESFADFLILNNQTMQIK